MSPEVKHEKQTTKKDSLVLRHPLKGTRVRNSDCYQETIKKQSQDMCSSAVLRKHCSTCQSRPFRSYNLHYPKRSLPQTEQVEQQHVPHALMHCFDSPNVCPNKKNAIIFDCLNHLLNHILNHLLNHL